MVNKQTVNMSKKESELPTLTVTAQNCQHKIIKNTHFVNYSGDFFTKINSSSIHHHCQHKNKHFIKIIGELII